MCDAYAEKKKKIIFRAVAAEHNGDAETMQKLSFVIGATASGKTYFINHCFKDTDAADIRAEKI